MMKRGAKSLEENSLIDNCLKAFDSNDEHNTWVIISDTHQSAVKCGVGNAGSSESGDWKIHISLERNKVREAIPLILKQVMAPDMPSFGIKFANPTLLQDDKSQPAKQVALILAKNFDPKQIETLLSNIANSLYEQGIHPEARTINSDGKSASYKWDAAILYTDDRPSYFNYRDENAVVMEDDLYIDTTGSNENFMIIPNSPMAYVKKSYFDNLPSSQKHNPIKKDDPLSNLIIMSPDMYHKKPKLLIAKDVVVNIDGAKELVKEMFEMINAKLEDVEKASALMSNVIDLIQKKNKGDGYNELIDVLGADIIDDEMFSNHYSKMASTLASCSVSSLKEIKEIYSHMQAVEIEKKQNRSFFSFL